MHFTPRRAEIGVAAAVAVAPDEIEAWQELVARGGVAGPVDRDAEAGGQEIRPQVIGAFHIGGGVDSEIGGGREFGDLELGAAGLKGSFTDQEPEFILDVPDRALGQQDRFLTRGETGAGLGDVGVGERADAVLLLVVTDELGREFARNAGDPLRVAGLLEVVEREDHVRDRVDHSLAMLPFGDAAICAGDAKAGEVGAEAEAAEQRLRDGQAAERGVVVRETVERAALVLGRAAEGVRETPRHESVERQAVIVGLRAVAQT